MENIFKPIESATLSNIVVRQIKNLIQNGKLKSGDSLPPERELTKMLNVSRPPLREALRVLEALGVIEVQPGVGSFVLDSNSLDPTSKYIVWLQEHQQEVSYLLEVRELLEPSIAGLAIERITDLEIEELNQNVEKMSKCMQDNDSESAIQLDTEFHTILIRSTRNPLFLKLNEGIQDSLHEVREAYFMDPKNIIISYQQHKRILDAIHKKNKSDIVFAMLDHVQTSRVITQKISDEGLLNI